MTMFAIHFTNQYGEKGCLRMSGKDKTDVIVVFHALRSTCVIDHVEAA